MWCPAGWSTSWSDPWLHEAQTGFRRYRGVDDVQQVTRKIVEEVNSVQGDDVVLLWLFDIEKAYPKLNKFV